MNNPYDELYHHGILGQKWGVRRYQNPDGTLTPAGRKKYRDSEKVITNKGKEISILERRNKSDDEIDFDVVSDGKKVATMYLENHGDDLYINWISTNKNSRGQGIANSMMDYVIKYAEKNNYKTMSLEVPGISEDAKHIYEKKGFKEGEKVSDDVVWEGLTSMKREVRR